MKSYKIFCIMCFFMNSAALHAEDLYVHTLKAPVFKTFHMGSDKLGELTRGEKVTVLDDASEFYKITFMNQDGWIYRFMVKKKPPGSPISLDSQSIRDFEERARKRPSSFSTTAAARGFMSGNKEFDGISSLAFADLRRMESFVKTEDEALRFIYELEEK